MNWRNALSLAVVVGIIALLGFGVSHTNEDLPSPLVGEAAPSFALQDLDADTTVGLAALKGRPVVVNFWASWCLACIQEHPVLVRTWQAYRNTDLVMLGVVFQDKPDNARRFLGERGGDWTQLMDPGTKTAIDFGVYGVPETFFIDRGGVIRSKRIGPVTDELMRVRIAELLGPEGSGSSAADTAAPAVGPTAAAPAATASPSTRRAAPAEEKR